jgi:hypothetical protein
MKNEEWEFDVDSDSDYYSVLISSGHSYHMLLSSLKNITIIDSNHTPTDHVNMQKYLTLIVDDVLLFGYNVEVSFSLSINNHIMLLEVEKLYPFVKDNIDFRIDLIQDVDIKHVVAILDDTVARDEANNNHIHYTDLKNRNTLKNVDIVDNALFYDGTLKESFLNNLIKSESFKFSFFDMSILNNGVSGIELRSEIYDMSIFINQVKVIFRLADDSYSWNFTDDTEFDILSIRQLFTLYLSKLLNKKITYLKREIQLIEMESI